MMRLAGYTESQQQQVAPSPPVGRTPWDLATQIWAEEPMVFVLVAAFVVTAVLAHLWGRWLQKTWGNK